MTVEEIQQLVCLQLGKERVDIGDRLYEDLGAESMDLVNLALAIEDRFAVFLSEEDLAQIKTVRNIFEIASLKRKRST